MRKYVLALAVAALLACGGDDDDHDPIVGEPTGTVCPEGGTSLTYEAFGRPFLEEFCLRCHSADVEGDARQGAPADHNFDTQFECQNLAHHMDEKAGAGPDATNQSMPPDDPRPDVEARRMLSEWLACGAP
jgi:hypothetical protein